jgi:TPR repeat protein
MSDNEVTAVKALVEALQAKDRDFWVELVPELTRLAGEGNAIAAYEAGLRLCYGWDVKADYAAAQKLLEAAVDAGVSDAKAPLIYCLLKEDPASVLRGRDYAGMYLEVVGKDVIDPKLS